MDSDKDASFVELTSSAAALETALAVPALRSTAIANPALPEPLWFQHYPAKPKPALTTAKALVARPLSPAQLDHVTTTEVRGAVISKAFKETPPTLDQLNSLLGSKALTAKLAGEIVDTYADVVDVAWLREAAKVGGSARLEYYLRAPQETTDAELIASLARYASWGATWDVERQHRLFATRPGVLPGGVISDGLKLRTSAAGCRFLLDPAQQRLLAEVDSPAAVDRQTPQDWFDDRAFVWVALVCNPACDLDVVRAVDPLLQRVSEYESRFRAANRLKFQPYRLSSAFEDVDDPQLLAWLIRRTLPGGSKGAGRPYDLAALLSNPHLGRGECVEITRLLRADLPVLFDPRFRGLFTDLLARFPDVAEDYSLDPKGFADLEAEQNEEIAKSARYQEANRLRDLAYDAPPTPEKIEEAGAVAVSSMWTMTRETTAYLDAHVDDAPASWLFVLKMLGQGDFAGSIADLAIVANLTA